MIETNTNTITNTMNTNKIRCTMRENYIIIRNKKIGSGVDGLLYSTVLSSTVQDYYYFERTYDIYATLRNVTSRHHDMTSNTNTFYQYGTSTGKQQYQSNEILQHLFVAPPQTTVLSTTMVVGFMRPNAHTKCNRGLESKKCSISDLIHLTLNLFGLATFADLFLVVDCR